MITETARAKINLTLWVGRKRPDGYHSIDSVMHSISLSDEITLEKSNEILLTVLEGDAPDRKSTRLNSSHMPKSRMPSSA